MIKDWVVVFFILIWIFTEAAGLSSILFKFIKSPKSPYLRLSLGIFSLCWIYFLMSLLSIHPQHIPKIHWAISTLFVIAGVTSFVQSAKRNPTWHLAWARVYSPLAWKNSGVWLVGPLIWAILKISDAMAPHVDLPSLSVHLEAVKLWLQQGSQVLNPLRPEISLTSIWDALYYHATSLLHLYSVHVETPYRSTLVQTHLCAQLLHLFAGQFLTIGIFYYFLCNTQKKPVALFMAWLVCAPTGIVASSVVAQDQWGLILILATAFVLAINDFAHPFCLALAWSFAFGIEQSTLSLLPAMTGLFFFTFKKRFRTAIFPLLSGTLVGCLPFIIKVFYFSFPKTSRLQTDSSVFNSVLNAHVFRPDQNSHFFFSAILVTLLGAVFYGLAKYEDKSFRFKNAFIETPWFVSAIALSLSSLFVALIFYKDAYSYHVVLCWMCLVSLAFYFFKLAQKKIKYLKMMALGLSLLTVTFPVHVLWQHLKLGFVERERYLYDQHPHFQLLRWINTNLSPTAQIAWSNYSFFYYLTNSSVSISDSSILKDGLSRADSAKARSELLCSLGFQYFAWQERKHGSETAGLSAWLKLNPENPVMQSEGIEILKLKCDPSR